jgi:hypothetical protein
MPVIRAGAGLTARQAPAKWPPIGEGPCLRLRVALAVVIAGPWSG